MRLDILLRPKLKAFFQRSINLGVNSEISLDKKRRIVIANQISFLLGFAAVPYFFIFQFVGFPTLSLWVIPTVFILFLCPFINYFKFYLISGYLMLLDAYFAILFYSCCFGKDAGIQNLYFALSGIPLIIFERKAYFSKFFLVLISLFLFFYLEKSSYDLFPRVFIGDSFTLIIFSTIALTTFVIIILTIQFYYFSNEQAENKLKAVNDDLKISNCMLEQAYLETQHAYDDLKKSKVVQEIMSNQAAYSQLVNGVAHEFKNPLHLMRARAEVTLERSDLDEDVRKLGNAVIKQVDRLDAILKPMLIYGRQNMSRKKSYFDLKEIVDDLSELAAPRCRKSKIEYIKPDILPDVFVAFADKDYVFQSVLNVLVNALQFTHEKGFISLNVGSGDYIDPNGKSRPGVWISVTDNGDGIDKDKIKTIFEPYSTSKKDPKNVGLGLSIVFRAIMENEGRIDVESERGQGTLFRLWVPAFAL